MYLGHKVLILWVFFYKSKVVKHAINPKLTKIYDVPTHEVIEALFPKLDELNAEKGYLGYETEAAHGIVEIVFIFGEKND